MNSTVGSGPRQAESLARDNEEPADGAENEERQERGQDLADYHEKQDAASDLKEQRPEPVRKGRGWLADRGSSMHANPFAGGGADVRYPAVAE